MARSTLRSAAGVLLAASLLLPAMAAAGEAPQRRGQAEPAPFLAGLWGSIVHLLPDEWRPITAFDQGDTGWLIDPDGDNAPPTPGADTGWLVDPDG